MPIRRQSERVPRFALRTRPEDIEIDAGRDVLDPRILEEGAFGGEVGKPFAWRHQGQTGFRPVPLLLPLSGRQVMSPVAAELGTAPAGPFESLAIIGVMTAAGQGPEIGKTPDDGLVEAEKAIDPGNGQEAAIDPIKPQDIAVADERVLL